MTFGEKLKALRKEHNLSQDDLAKKICVPRTMVSQLEAGQCYPSIENLKLLAKLFDTTIPELISDVGSREFENLIMNWWAENLVDIKRYIADAVDGYQDDEKIGLYIIFSYLCKYFKDNVNAKNLDNTKKFLDLLEQFRNKFGEIYQKFSTETMDNFIGVAFFEDVIDRLSEEDLSFVLPLFDKRLTSEYYEYQEADHQTLLEYLNYLLKDKVKNIKIEDKDKTKYKFFNDVDLAGKVSTLNIADFISLTKKHFYVSLNNGFCYLGELVKNNEIHLLRKDRLPMYLIQNSYEIFN